MSMLERLKALAMPKEEEQEVVTLSSGEEVSFFLLSSREWLSFFLDQKLLTTLSVVHCLQLSVPDFVEEELELDPEKKLMQEHMGFSNFTAKWQTALNEEEEEVEMKEERPSFRFKVFIPTFHCVKQTLFQCVWQVRCL